METAAGDRPNGVRHLASNQNQPDFVLMVVLHVSVSPSFDLGVVQNVANVFL